MLSTHHTCQHRFQNDVNETETETEGPQTPLADSSTQKDLPRIERTAQTIHCWEPIFGGPPRAFKAELGIMDARVTRWMKSLNKLPDCVKSKADVMYPGIQARDRCMASCTGMG